MLKINFHLGFLWIVVILPSFVSSSYPLPRYPRPESKYINPEFVPAMPGKTPACLKDPRLTFCLEPDKYPKDRIVYLVENKMYDTDTLLRDETRDTYVFEAREARTIHTYKNGYSTNPVGNISASPSSYATQYSPPQSPPVVLYGTKSPPPHYDNRGPYPRYPRDSQHNAIGPYQPPRPHRTFWKKILRRTRRQATLSELCPARGSYITPRAAQGVGGDWGFLVNVDNRYRQVVKSETCIQNTCQGACDVPAGFLAICQQQYVQKRLIALDGSGAKLNSDTFWFPSCCLCRIVPASG